MIKLDTLVTEVTDLGWLAAPERFSFPGREPFPPGAGRERAPQCPGQVGG